MLNNWLCFINNFWNIEPNKLQLHVLIKPTTPRNNEKVENLNMNCSKGV